MKKIKYLLIITICLFINIYQVNAQRTINNGTYIISSALDETKNIDVADAKTTNGTNIQLYQNNGNNAQKWDIKYLDNGYYSIISKLNKNKCLTVKGENFSNYTNIQLYDCNNSNSQQFIIKDLNNGYFSIITKTNSMYIDVDGAKTTNGTNIQLYQNNGNKAQKFKLTEVINPTKNINNGTYIISSALDETKNIDVAGAKTTNGTNIQLYQDNGNNAQKWDIKYLNNGYYSIISKLNKNKCLDIQNGNFSIYSNIQLYDCNNSNAQQFIIKDLNNGYFSIISKINHLYIDISGARTTNGTNVQLFYNNDNKAQKFKFTEVLNTNKTINDGTYTIYSALDENKTIDVAGAKTTNGTNIQLYQDNGNNAQKWDIKYLNNGYYSIISKLDENKCLEVQESNFSIYSNIQLYDCNNSDAQQFIIKDLNNTYFSIISKINHLYVDVDGAKTANNTNIQLFYNNDNKAQKFKFVEVIEPKKTIKDGTYIISSSLNENKNIDVAEAKTTNGTNIQLYENNGNKAQKWNIKYLNNGYYSITSKLNNNKCLDVKNGNFTIYSNIQLYDCNNSNAQQFIIKELDNGYFSIISKVNHLYVDVAGAKTNNNTNIQLFYNNDNKAQKFKFTENFVPQKTVNDGNYIISTVLNTNMNIDVSGASRINGTNIQLYQNNGNNAQKWDIKYLNNGYYSITSSLNNNTSLDLKNGIITNGTNIQLYKVNNSDAQQWQIIDLDNEEFAIQSKKSNICLTVNNSVATNGTNIQANTCNYQNNQKFKLVKYTGTKTYTGIDVSQYQGTVDWSKVASTNIGFVMLRLGYGDNWTSQDDKKFITNVNELEKYNIPYGVYLYSYAKNITGSTALNANSESATSEAAHVIRVLNSITYKPNLKTAVYIDMEDDSTVSLGKTKLTSIADKFCSTIESNGYNCGIYANTSWLTNNLDAKSLANKYSIWLAEWTGGNQAPSYTQAISLSPKYNLTNYKLWQFSSHGSINGITGNVDVDLGFDIFD